VCDRPDAAACWPPQTMFVGIIWGVVAVAGSKPAKDTTVYNNELAATTRAEAIQRL